MEFAIPVEDGQNNIEISKVNKGALCKPLQLAIDFGKSRKFKKLLIELGQKEI